jgi:STAM-binding protein
MLAAGEHRDLAVQLAHGEIRRRRTALDAARQAGRAPADYPAAARRVAGAWDPLDDMPDPQSRGAGEGYYKRDPHDDGQARMQDARRWMDQRLGPAGRAEAEQSMAAVLRQREAEARAQAQARADAEARAAAREFHYPTVPKRQPLRYEDWTPPPLPPSAARSPPARGILKPPRPPELPPKGLPPPDAAATAANGSVAADAMSRLPPPPLSPPPPPPPQHPPPLPPTLQPPPYAQPPPRPALSSPSLSVRSASPSSPSSSRGLLQPSDFTFKPAAYLENGTPLRTMFLPPDLRLAFLDIAAPNTRRNLETCGILCGTLMSNALFVSKLIIPEQQSTSDTCETTNESALFDYCDAEDLIVLGWIHTHPTQMCFMSSRDLHTHSGYQVMLPESIAIVCAPSRDPS